VIDFGGRGRGRGRGRASTASFDSSQHSLPS